MMNKIGIVGLGHVGSNMKELFKDVVIYDEPKNIGSKEEINSCDISFICVPTPAREDGSCDTSIVESVLNWVNTDVIVIRSTVPVGFTDNMVKKLSKNIVFQPEYYGETIDHPFSDPKNRSWITLGGNLKDSKKVANVYKNVFNSNIIFQFTDSKTAELAKYMENSFLATKVTFCNQFYDLANSLGVDYDLLRETWLLDPRIGRSHTFVYDCDRGFGGSCLPKDLKSIIHQADELGLEVPLLKSVLKTNELYKK